MDTECTSCGAQIREGHRFCASCGTPAAEAAQPEPPTPEHEPSVETVESQPAPAAQPQPEAPPVADTAPPKPAEPVVLSVPEWVVGGWEPPLTFAGLALGIGVAIQLVVSLVLLVLVQVLASFMSIDWGATLKAPFTLFAAFHGTMSDVGLWLTGAAWIWVAFRLAYDRMSVPAMGPREVWRFAAKVAIPYAIVVAVLAAIFKPDPVPILGSGLSGTLPAFGATQWTVATAVFFALIMSFVLSMIVVARKQAIGLGQLLGIEIAVPRQIRAAWRGAIRVFAVAVPTLLGLLLIGTFLDFIDAGVGFSSLVALLLSLVLAAILWAGLDVAFVFMVSSMRFLADDLINPDEQVWAWAGVALVAFAFFMGGRLAAEQLPAADGREAVATGAFVGIVVAAMAFVASWFVIGIGENLVGPAVGLPLLWSAASAIGGAVYANQKGLSMGIRIETGGSGDQG